MNSSFRNIFLWVLVLLLQVILLFYVNFLKEYTPYIYPILLLKLSNKISQIGKLFIAFTLGLFIDILLNSYGIHIFASVLVVYITPIVLNLFTKQSITDLPNISSTSLGVGRQLFVLFILLLLHHWCITLLWNFSIKLLPHLLLQATLSALIALLFSFITLNITGLQKTEENG